MRSGVYSITHVASGRMYVGSSNDIGRRWYHHRRSLRANTHHAVLLQRAWNKYGEDAFAFAVVALVEGEAERLALESSYIKPGGYNTAPVAGTCLGVKWSRRLTPEEKEAKAVIWRGRKHSEETKAKMSAAAIARKRHLTDDQKAAVSRVHRGKSISPEHRAISAETCRKRNTTPEHRAKVSAALKGREVTQEWRDKLRQAWVRRRAATPEMLGE